MIIFLCKKRYVLLVLSFVLLISTFGKVEIYGEENLSMYSGCYALTDARTNRVLAGKKETTPMANASTTKILTCIITLEQCSLAEQVTISKNAVNQPKVRLGMKVGEVYSLEELVYALMLESYNDCAVAIAEHVGGSEEGFAKLLNEKALQIGCKDTYFITPNGLDEEDEIGFHHTTAEDLCKIMAYCVWESPQKDLFLEITQTRSYKSFVNRNSFLDQMEGVVSGKTGYTSKAGYCYVAAFEREGERYCIALLACGWPNNKTYKWKDAKVLLNHGLENYDLVKKEEEWIKEKIQVDGYVGKETFATMNRIMALEIQGISGVLEFLISENEKLDKEIIVYKDVKLPVEKGQKLGECNYYLDDVLLESVPLVAQDGASFWTLPQIMKIIFTEFLSFS
ncbi:MAG: D-alanyl-D-alanine carboxypeptidase [Lachnospiraceae bacterium]|nr:D-alanyl-D-alanine carboxypeptidase [Lachnospiraceae bacterium]